MVYSNGRYVVLVHNEHTFFTRFVEGQHYTQHHNIMELCFNMLFKVNCTVQHLIRLIFLKLILLLLSLLFLLLLSKE